jgi:hypothetical protein
MEENDRVRANTAEHVQHRIDTTSRLKMIDAASQGNYGISQRIDELDYEWDTDRVIEVQAAAVAIGGIALGAAVNRRFYWLPAIAAASVLVHAIHGCHPLLPILRRMGFRSAGEIDRERYALKALRGDYQGVEPSSNGIASNSLAASAGNS